MGKRISGVIGGTVPTVNNHRIVSFNYDLINIFVKIRI